MTTIQSEHGKIKYFLNMGSAHLPVASTLTGTSVGPFVVTGSINETDCGIVPISKSGGWARLTGTDEDGYGIAVGTNVCWSPALNNPLIWETRLEMQVLTARTVFVGFASANATDVVEPLTSTGTTLTPVATSYAGFWYDSQLTMTLGNSWHMVHNGGTTTGETLSTDVDAIDDFITAAQSQILRVEVDLDGTVRWLIDGVLRQTIEAAVSTTTLLAGLTAVFGTTTTVADLDVNYIAFEANDDFTV